MRVLAAVVLIAASLILRPAPVCAGTGGAGSFTPSAQLDTTQVQTPQQIGE